jgi:pyroglutamyl-peptidase
MCFRERRFVTARIGLVTGSHRFAGLPTNPAEAALPHVEGIVAEGITVVTRSTPVSFARLPALLAGLISEHRPAFVLALGVALGTPVVKVEAMALNAAHFAVPDSEGARPRGGRRFADDAPDALPATWDATAVVDAIVAADVPARVSFHAGTHLCNLTLFTYLAALKASGSRSPCGFLHLPYLPEQVAWLIRQRGDVPDTAPGTNLDLPSMALATQVTAVKAAIAALARQASALPHP